MANTEYLGEFEHLILLAIARRGGQAGGVDVHGELETVTTRGASLPAIYVTLARLEKKGFIRTSDLVERESGGRPRRLFEITRAGARVMQETRRTLERMWMDVPALGRNRR